MSSCNAHIIATCVGLHAMPRSNGQTDTQT